MKHFRHKTCLGRNFVLLIGILLFTGFISHSLCQIALAQTEIPLEGQSAIIEKSLRQSIPLKTTPQDPSKSKSQLLNKGRMHASDFAALISPSNNNGIVVAKLGTVNMVSGESTTVDFVGNDLILFAVSKSVKGKVLDKDGNKINDQISQSTSLQSKKGRKVILTARNASSIIQNVINMEGVMKASTVIQKGGCTFLVNSVMTRSNKSIEGMSCF